MRPKIKIIFWLITVIVLILISILYIDKKYKQFKKISSVYIIDCTIFDSLMIPLIDSVQLLDEGSFLFSDMAKGGHFTVVGSDGKKIIDYYHPQIDRSNNLPQNFHTIRLVKYQNLSQEVQKLLDKNPEIFLFKYYFKFLEMISIL
jgi:hypothetical protein